MMAAFNILVFDKSGNAKVEQHYFGKVKKTADELPDEITQMAPENPDEISGIRLDEKTFILWQKPEHFGESPTFKILGLDNTSGGYDIIGDMVIKNAQEMQNILLTLRSIHAITSMNGSVYDISWKPKFSSEDEDFEKGFYRLVSEWKKETALHSSVTQICMHPAYQRIISLGYKAVPLILKELKRRPDHWFWALQAITGENPIPKEHAGNMVNMAADWLTLGTKRGWIE